MGKILLSVLLILATLNVFAQGPEENAKLKIGLKAGLAISSNRATTNSDSLTASTDGVGGRLLFGPMFDFSIGDNYYVSTGIYYTSKRAGLSVTNRNDNTVSTEVHSLQYVQLPVALKLYTNEVALDTRIYFLVGSQLEFNVNEKLKKGDSFYIRDFRALDMSVNLGAGIEMRAGVNTSFFAGLSYTRGLTNTISQQAPADSKIILKNDLFSLDFGIKF